MTRARAGDGRGGGRAHVTWALLAELTLLGGFAVGWEVTGGRPGGWAQFCLLAAGAAGMGVQSSAVKHMGLTEVSTTYLTGTLTGLVSSLVSPGPPAQDRWRRLGVLLGLAAGASLTGLLVATAPDGVPALPLAALITCVVLATWPLTAGQAPQARGEGRGQIVDQPAAGGEAGTQVRRRGSVPGRVARFGRGRPGRSRTSRCRCRRGRGR